jgi:hypothetical protein
MTLEPSPRTGSVAARIAAGMFGAALVAACQSGTPSASREAAHAAAPSTSTASPAEDDGVPVGDAPHIPYIVGDTLYLANKAQKGSYFEVQSAGRSAVGFRPGSSDLVTPVVFRDGRKVAVLRASVGGTRLSPDGTMLARFEVVDGADHLVLRDLRSGTDVDRVPVDTRAMNPDFYGNLNAASVTDRGTVIYTTNARTYFAWHPGTTPIRVPAPRVRKPPRGFASDASSVALNDAGTWAVWVTDRAGRNPESPEANGVTDGATFERRGDPQSRFTVTFPNGGGAYKLLWESGTEALLDFLIEGEGSSDRYLRCSVVTHQCEYAPTPANPTL